MDVLLGFAEQFVFGEMKDAFLDVKLKAVMSSINSMKVGCHVWGKTKGGGVIVVIARLPNCQYVVPH